jgi:hypothetical protein
MPTWNEAEYIGRSSAIAHDFVTTRKPLSDLCEKVAREEALSPDEIRTLVRLSNVAAFQEIFREKARANDPDRMVEFDVGDPEAVIQRIRDSVANPPRPATALNDKLAGAIPDEMRAIRLGLSPEPPTFEKAAAEVEPPRPLRVDRAILTLRKLASELAIERQLAGNRWESSLSKLARVFRKVPGYGPSYLAFEKDAWSEHGLTALPEVTFLRETLRLPPPAPDAEKIAFIAARHLTRKTAELELLREAVSDREAFVKLTSGLRWITENTPAR